MFSAQDALQDLLERPPQGLRGRGAHGAGDQSLQGQDQETFAPWPRCEAGRKGDVR